MAAIIGSSVIPVSGLAAVLAEDTITVMVNAPEVVNAGGTFDVTIDVDKIVNLNSGQFDLTFDSSVLKVTDVKNGCLDEATIPVDRCEFMDKDTIRVLLEVTGITGVSGSGYLARISFEVVGKGGDKSVLDISKGILYNNEAEKIPAEWIDDEIIVKIVKTSAIIKMDKPVYKPGETQIITLTLVNPTDTPVLVNLGMGFKVYEIMGHPYPYEIPTLFETGMFWLPANFKYSFDLPVKGLVLPKGKYAWTAYLKDGEGKKISEREAKFDIAAFIRTSTVPSEGMFKEMTASVQKAINAELL